MFLTLQKGKERWCPLYFQWHVFARMCSRGGNAPHTEARAWCSVPADATAIGMKHRWSRKYISIARPAYLGNELVIIKRISQWDLVRLGYWWQSTSHTRAQECCAKQRHSRIDIAKRGKQRLLLTLPVGRDFRDFSLLYRGFFLGKQSGPFGQTRGFLLTRKRFLLRRISWPLMVIPRDTIAQWTAPDLRYHVYHLFEAFWYSKLLQIPNNVRECTLGR